MSKIKVIFVGDGEVGKTSLITQFTTKTFNTEHMMTLPGDNSSKQLEVNGEILNLEIWDTAGQEKFRTTNKIFMKNAKIVIFVVDITNKNSINGLNYWFKEVKDNLDLNNVVTGIASNKSDLYEKREFEQSEIDNFAKKNNIDFTDETSARDFDSIHNFFVEIGKKYIEKHKGNNNEDNDINHGSIKVDKKSIKQKKNSKNGCC